MFRKSVTKQTLQTCIVTYNNGIRPFFYPNYVFGPASSPHDTGPLWYIAYTSSVEHIM